MESTKRQFLETLELQIVSRLDAAKIRDVAVRTYEHNGGPLIELSGTEERLKEAKSALRNYTGMIVAKVI